MRTEPKTTIGCPRCGNLASCVCGIRKKPLTKHNLDQASRDGCQEPGCDDPKHQTLFLHARCHKQGRLEVSYRHGSGVLRVACRECQKVVALISVKDEEVAQRLLDQAMGVAKREYPEGRLGPHDEGALNIAIATDPASKTVIINFAKPVVYLGLSAKGCIDLAQGLIKHARGISDEPFAIEI